MTRVKMAAEAWAPNWAVHPGDVLEEHLEARGLTQASLSQ